MHEIREEEEENVSTTGGVKAKGVGLGKGVLIGRLGKLKKKIILGREDSKNRFCECKKNMIDRVN